MFKADCDICVGHYFIAIIFKWNKRQTNLQPVILKAFKGSAGQTIGFFERGVWEILCENTEGGGINVLLPFCESSLF